MRSMQWQLGILGTVSAFVFRHRETKKNLCRGGRSQDLPTTDFQPAVWHLKKKKKVKKKKKAQINLNCVIAYFELSAKIKKLKYSKYELSAERETFINFSDVKTVTADSRSLTDTVGTESLTVAAVNKCYCRHIRSCPAQELTAQTILIPQPFSKNFQGLFCVSPMF